MVIKKGNNFFTIYRAPLSTLQVLLLSLFFPEGKGCGVASVTVHPKEEAHKI